MDPNNSSSHVSGEKPKGKYLAFMSLAALGIVYGDIGTSPIYALRESLHGSYGLAHTETTILGILSLIFWSLIIVISIKYLAFVMLADNRGEGGIIALTALVSPRSRTAEGGQKLLIMAGLFGAALQSRGTARIGVIFGPIVLLWFLTLGALGVSKIIENPSVFVATDSREFWCWVACFWS